MIQAVLPFMPRSGGSRIVNVSSRAGSFGYLRGAMPAYTVSKTALNAITCHFASELADKRILVNAVDPAASATEMTGGLGRSAAESAATVVWAANLPDDGPTGGFFRDCEPIPW
jgi:NAD(P)-dependent dehydrogenase (short-subunit alcohol dehydrogenase family)